MIRLFQVFIPTSIIALLFSEIILTLSCFLLAAYLVVGPDYGFQTFLFDDQGLERIFIVVAIIILGLYLNDLYTEVRLRSRVQTLQQLSVVIGIPFIVQAFLVYVQLNLVLSKWMMIVGAALSLVVLFLWRIAFSTVISRAVGARRLLFLGSSSIAFQVSSHLLSRPELGWLPIGYLDDVGESPDISQDVPRLGAMADLKAVVAALNPHSIVVAMKERRAHLPVYDLLELRFSGVHIEDVANLYEVTFGKVCTQEVRPSQLVFSTMLGPSPGTLRLQRFYSFVIGLIATLPALPVMAIVACLVKLTSSGPVLFSQIRVGLQGRTFRIYKFRSMRQDAEAKTGAVWAQRNDPRITPIGQWLRKLRLDELPQFFNVLRGDMSIVGPRPERPEFVKVLSEKIPYYRQRHSVMPGITGWAQINYKYGDTIEDTIQKLEYDLYYIKHVSMSLDMFIMFHTLKVMLLSRGSQ